MSLPGPSGGIWGLGLLAWALAVVVLGDFVRQVGGRLIPSWRRLEPIERGLTDFYLGGGLLYLLAALPVGLFVAPVVDANNPAAKTVCCVPVGLAAEVET